MHTPKKKKKQKELPDNFIVIGHLYTILIQYLFKKKKSKKQANSKAYCEEHEDHLHWIKT